MVLKHLKEASGILAIIGIKGNELYLLEIYGKKRQEAA